MESGVIAFFLLAALSSVLKLNGDDITGDLIFFLWQFIEAFEIQL